MIHSHQDVLKFLESISTNKYQFVAELLTCGKPPTFLQNNPDYEKENTLLLVDILKCIHGRIILTWAKIYIWNKIVFTKFWHQSGPSPVVNLQKYGFYYLVLYWIISSQKAYVLNKELTVSLTKSSFLCNPKICIAVNDFKFSLGQFILWKANNSLNDCCHTLRPTYKIIYYKM